MENNSLEHVEGAREKKIVLILGHQSIFKPYCAWNLWRFLSPLSSISRLHIQDAVDSLQLSGCDYVFIVVDEMCRDWPESVHMENHVSEMIPKQCKDRVIILVDSKACFAQKVAFFIAQNMPKVIVTIEIRTEKNSSYLKIKERLMEAINILAKNFPSISRINFTQGS